MSDDRKGARAKVSDGIRQGIGVLSAFKDAIEETIADAREKGDLSTDRAREVMKSALHKAQEAAGEARERLDFVTQAEHETLKEAIEKIHQRVSSIEVRLGPEDGADSSE